MSCRITEDNLIGFMSDELSGREKQNLENHIMNCGYCQNRIQELNQLKLAWDNPIDYLDDTFTNKVLVSITTSDYVKKKRKSYKNELLHFALAATATIALFTTGVFDHYFYALNEYSVSLAKGTNEFYLLFIKGSIWLDSLQIQIINSFQIF